MLIRGDVARDLNSNDPASPKDTNVSRRADGAPQNRHARSSRDENGKRHSCIHLSDAPQAEILKKTKSCRARIPQEHAFRGCSLATTCKGARQKRVTFAEPHTKTNMRIPFLAEHEGSQIRQSIEWPQQMTKLWMRLDENKCHVRRNWVLRFACRTYFASVSLPEYIAFQKM